MLHLIDWKAELARLEFDNASDCEGAEVGGGSPARVHLALTEQTDNRAEGRVHLALTEPCLDDHLLRMCVEREFANLIGE